LQLRKLNEAGLAEFSSYVNKLRDGLPVIRPHYLLTDERTSCPTKYQIFVRSPKFDTRYDMAVYLVDLLKGLDAKDKQSLIGDTGLWSWLALLWFDQFCPKNSAGNITKPSKANNFVMSSDYRHRPRHAVYMSWQLVDRYGVDARFMLSKSLDTRGEIIEQIAGRQEIIGQQGVIKLASKLYSDQKTKGFKKGAAARVSQGCIARYINWLTQLKVNYDLFSIDEVELEKMLPKEFDRFLKRGILKKSGLF
jgi:hypothetical protein